MFWIRDAVTVFQEQQNFLPCFLKKKLIESTGETRVGLIFDMSVASEIPYFPLFRGTLLRLSEA